MVFVLDEFRRSGFTQLQHCFESSLYLDLFEINFLTYQHLFSFRLILYIKMPKITKFYSNNFVKLLQ